MASRHAIEVFDQRFSTRQQLGPAVAYTGPTKHIELDAETSRKLADALAKEAEKMRQREDERRRRDPTFRPDALDHYEAPPLPHSKQVDYYKQLGVDQHASAAELKAAYKRRALELHPDKQGGKSEEEAEAAAAEYILVCGAYEILSHESTRRAYDKARDSEAAAVEAGVATVGECKKPPPTCVDLPLSLEELFRGCDRAVRYVHNYFAGTKWARKEEHTAYVRVRRGTHLC